MSKRPNLSGCYIWKVSYTQFHCSGLKIKLLSKLEDEKRKNRLYPKKVVTCHLKIMLRATNITQLFH